MQQRLLDPDIQLPTSEELPCSDDTPVDNENQNTIPNWLIAILDTRNSIRNWESARRSWGN